MWVVAAPAGRRLGSVSSEEADLCYAAVCHSVLLRLSGCTCFCDSVFGLDLAFSVVFDVCFGFWFNLVCEWGVDLVFGQNRKILKNFCSIITFQ